VRFQKEQGAGHLTLLSGRSTRTADSREAGHTVTAPLVEAAAAAAVRLVADLVVVVVAVPAAPVATAVEAVVVTAPLAAAIRGAAIRVVAVLAEVAAEVAAVGAVAQAAGEDLAKSNSRPPLRPASVHPHYDHCHVIRLLG
jgi:hypothetical protein